MDVKVTPDMPLRVLKVIRKKMKKDGTASKAMIEEINRWIKSKQDQHHAMVEVTAKNRIIEFLKRATK